MNIPWYGPVEEVALTVDGVNLTRICRTRKFSNSWEMLPQEGDERTPSEFFDAREMAPPADEMMVVKVFRVLLTIGE